MVGKRRGLSWLLPAVLDRAPTILCDSRTPQAEEGSEDSAAVTYFFPRHFNGGEGESQAEAVINCPLNQFHGLYLDVTKMTDENPQKRYFWDQFSNTSQVT